MQIQLSISAAIIKVKTINTVYFVEARRTKKRRRRRRRKWKRRAKRRRRS